jgi:hypothetical protein
MPNQIALHRFISELAYKKRVLLVGNDFELLQLLAMTEVLDLVIFDKHADPDAPQGETPLGAPLRFRSDWKERPRSKDLIIDPSGTITKTELERLLKKAGVYVCDKKRRMTGFESKQLESRALAADLIGAPDAVSNLSWAIPGSETPCDSRSVSWLFTRGSFDIPSVAVAHGWGHSAGPEDAQRLKSLEKTLSVKDATLAQAQLALSETKKTNIELKRELKALSEEHKRLAMTVEHSATELASLRQEKSELERENDQLSGVAATLRADENRFKRLNERFQKYQLDSGKEVEALQNDLRALAVPGQDRQLLSEERDAAKTQLAEILTAFNALFQNALSNKRVPKLPPVEVNRPDAPLKLWLAKMEALLSAQQVELTTFKTENQGLRKSLKVAERKAALKVAPATKAKRAQTLSVTLSPITSSERETQLQNLLDIEHHRSAQLERSIKTTLKRVNKMTEAYTHLVEQVDQLEGAQAQERGLRIAAEADQALLKHELNAKHAELEERGNMLDTYASLQSLLSDSLTQAEEARLDAEDGRRLSDENLRILQEEFERVERSGPKQ